MCRNTMAFVIITSASVHTFAQHNTVFKLARPDTGVKGGDNTLETVAEFLRSYRIFHLGLEIYCQRRSIVDLLESLLF